jgi:hypothetical protein
MKNEILPEIEKLKKNTNEINYNKLNLFVKRLEKLGIRIDLIGNFPWVYLNKVNDKTVKEKFKSEYGFTITFLPHKNGQELEFTDIREIFKTIRKYL